MKCLIGQAKAKRGIAAALINPYLDRVCIAGARGTGKTTLLQMVLSYFSKEDAVIIPSHITTEKLLGEKEIALFSQNIGKPNNQSILHQAKVVITDQFALMPENNQRLVVQLLKNKGMSFYQDFHYPATSKWFYCLDQEMQDTSLLKHAKLCVRLIPVLEVSEREDILVSRGNPEQEYTKEELKKAKDRLSSVQIPEKMLQLAVEVVIRSGCKNQEADMDLIETARSLAALDSDQSVQPKHIEEAAGYALTHRMGEQQESTNPENSEQQVNEESSMNSSEDTSHSHPSSGNEENPLDYDGQDQEASGDSIPNEAPQDNPIITEVSEEEVDQVIASLKMQSDFLFSKQHTYPSSGNGKHREGTSAGGNGRMLRAVQRPAEAISLYHTLTAAAPYMKVRIPPEGMKLAIEKEDIRYKLKEKQQGFTILFLVDASRSIAAKKNMRVIKGAIMELFQQAYQKRDRIGMVTFRKTESEEVLSFTNKFAEAKRKLGEIPTGGKTPLAAGLEKALKLCEKEKRANKQGMPYLVILTDGNANETLKPGGTAAQARSEAYQTAKRIAQEQLPVTVIDTQSGRNAFGLAEELAAVIEGEYLSLDTLTDKNIAKAVQSRLHPLEGRR
ncbi:VWA domain-containing protein [Oceanobacillus neutriphilus]|uniref:Magnesium chelatase n=1 Tax=Oceanobacillus neutriphilus TaxID=531815 RepID=A0ABQ2NR83_9BACI|nr:VWA domain-containing protein [Oceanobacillus neutriphilus]GGP08334.1 magnesium chelatase [Oceanobacillus neutriphilus]